MFIYKKHFRKILISETKQYYKQKTRCWLDAQSCHEYLIDASETFEKFHLSMFMGRTLTFLMDKGKTDASFNLMQKAKEF